VSRESPLLRRRVSLERRVPYYYFTAAKAWSVVEY